MELNFWGKYDDMVRVLSIGASKEHVVTHVDNRDIGFRIINEINSVS